MCGRATVPALAKQCRHYPRRLCSYFDLPAAAKAPQQVQVQRPENPNVFWGYYARHRETPPLPVASSCASPFSLLPSLSSPATLLLISSSLSLSSLTLFSLCLACWTSEKDWLYNEHYQVRPRATVTLAALKR